MKILFISAELPYPDHSGGTKYTWQKIRELSMSNEIILVCFNENQEILDESVYRKYVKKVYSYSRKKDIMRIILNFYKPYTLISRVNKDMNEKISEIILKEQVDMILLDSIHMYYSISNIKTKIPIYLTQHNIEYKLFASISKKINNPIKRIIYKIESIKLKKIEKNLYKHHYFRGYIFISNDDLNEYEQEIGKVNAICIPPCIENNFINKSKKNIEIEKNSIVFTGKMNYEPNITAVKWFVESILPLIQKEIPKVKFYIVGKNPTEEVKKYENSNIIVTGEVDDIYSYIEKAQIVVIPLLSGGGVKLKLFDALSMNKIIVSTSKGIEGTCFKNEIDLYVTDDAELFAKRCIENLKEPNNNMAKKGKETLELNYSFEYLQKKLQKFIEE